MTSGARQKLKVTRAAFDDEGSCAASVTFIFCLANRYAAKDAVYFDPFFSLTEGQILDLL